MTRISRRTLIGAGAATAVAIPLGLVAVPALATPEQVIVRYVRRSLPGLAVGDAELLDFAQRRLQAFAVWSRPKLVGILAAVDNPAAAGLLSGPMARAHDWFTRRVLTSFLFSTDFFGEAGAVPARTRYIAFADPYELGCGNPLSRSEPGS